MHSESSHEEQNQYISIKKAGEELGVGRTTMYYYIEQLQIKTHPFPLDRKKYITRDDLERIKAAKMAAKAGER